jgi:hypothetical protein
LSARSECKSDRRQCNRVKRGSGDSERVHMNECKERIEKMMEMKKKNTKRLVGGSETLHKLRLLNLLFGFILTVETIYSRGYCDIFHHTHLTFHLLRLLDPYQEHYISQDCFPYLLP